MSYKILTKNGIDNTNIDGARGEYFNTGMRDGIVKGILNEGNLINNTSNGILFDTCELRIAGHRILIDEPYYKTFENIPNSNIRYSLIAQIVVDDNSDVDFSFFIQTTSTLLLRQDDLYANLNGSGIYQVEIGRFTQQDDGIITDVIRTIDIITGASSVDGSGTINIGNITTEKIDYSLDAEVDIDTRYDEEQEKEFVDFKFSLPVDISREIDNKVSKVEGKDLSTNDFTDDYKSQVDSNTSARHTHLNKSILDATTASYTTEDKIKLSEITNAKLYSSTGTNTDGAMTQKATTDELDLRAKTDASNLSDSNITSWQGKLLNSNIAGNGINIKNGAISTNALDLPSTTYETLTLTSGNTYTAPANGWFAWVGQSTIAEYSNITFKNLTNGIWFRDSQKANLAGTFGLFPVRKGDEVTVSISGVTVTDSTERFFRFYYAEGEV